MSSTARKPKVPRPLEREIQKSCIAILQRLGFQVFRRNVGGRRWTDKNGKGRVMKFGVAGQSDTYGWLPGGPHIEVEIKRPGGWPTPQQIEWLMYVNATGAIAFWVANTTDLEMVARHILAGGRTEFVGIEGQYKLVGGTR